MVFCWRVFIRGIKRENIINRVIKSAVLIYEEAVLMGTEGDLLFGINAVGSEIWKQLQLQPVSVEDLSQHLVAYFEVSELRCLTDTKEFIDKLFSQNLILKVN
jgi:hypothetical protein